jgi:hypothetical protein
MKILLYLLTALFGFLGVGTALRAVELSMSGAPLRPQSIVTGIFLLALALACWGKASAKPESKS